DGVTCTCDRPLPATCAGQTLPARVQRLSARACRFFGNAVDATPGRKRHRLRQGVRALRHAIKTVVQAQLHGLASDCAADLADGYRGASQRASILADSL